jgi:DNA-binding CsgD family transcriptional regulator
MASQMRGLTPREIEICNLIRGGMSSKEIAHLLDVTDKTVETHRRNIREKLGILNKRVNLASLLRTLEDPSALEQAGE